MAQSTEISEGLHLVRPYKAGSSCTITIPYDLAKQMGIIPGMTFAVIKRIAGCLVITKITDVSPDGALAEFSDALAGLGPEVGQAEADRNARR